jgi:tryptophan-rich sensory protein
VGGASAADPISASVVRRVKQDMTAPDDSGRRLSLSLAVKAATREFVMDDIDARRARYRPLGLFLLVTLAVGGTASLFTEPSIPTWYAGLIKPSFNPPNWVFAPVWTTLYVLMAVAAWRVWRKTGLKDIALYAFWAQLFLNFCWSGIFFGLHQPGWALAELLLLDLALVATLALFWTRDRIAGLLLAPYLAWTSFASLLNYEIWRLNP